MGYLRRLKFRPYQQRWTTLHAGDIEDDAKQHFLLDKYDAADILYEQ